MGPNDVELVRVFTRRPKSPIADVTFEATGEIEVVLEAECGSTLLGGGGKYQAEIIVRDITANTNIPFKTAGPTKGSFMDANWPQEDQKFVYHVEPSALKGRGGHLCQVYAYLLVGLRNFDADFKTGELFLIEP
ncbi:hypothetical protein SAMN05216489_08103 [Streptomyces sp. 3213]|uniref:hypothetical protein n=1 Tax=Streptomyces sp. 3213.3 TaxID=1855348 RepID=UPI00089C1844|nr:hypothetical protein [Streptomyces sp. 3213.3]SEE74075.1 hypothetical protein SAMN05216489_08103 [Streptomyces sp. 3213] [Streptomyces sp. 3213.3]